MKTRNFNLNNYVQVQLNAKGHAIHRKAFDELIGSHPRSTAVYRPPTEDIEGWSTWQMWELFETFGPRMRDNLPPFRFSVRIEVTEES